MSKDCNGTSACEKGSLLFGKYDRLSIPRQQNAEPSRENLTKPINFHYLREEEGLTFED